MTKKTIEIKANPELEGFESIRLDGVDMNVEGDRIWLCEGENTIGISAECFDEFFRVLCHYAAKAQEYEQEEDEDEQET